MAFTPAASPAPVVAIRPGLYAIQHINNWDGEKDDCTSLARLDADGRWTYEENGAPVLQYVGDEVLRAWPLSVESSVGVYDSLSAAERIAVWEVELAGQPLKVFQVGDTDIVTARNERQALEVFFLQNGEGSRDSFDLGDVVDLTGHEKLDKPGVDEEGEPGPCANEMLIAATGPDYLFGWE